MINITSLNIIILCLTTGIIMIVIQQDKSYALWVGPTSATCYVGEEYIEAGKNATFTTADIDVGYFQTKWNLSTLQGGPAPFTSKTVTSTFSQNFPNWGKYKWQGIILDDKWDNDIDDDAATPYADNGTLTVIKIVLKEITFLSDHPKSAGVNLLTDHMADFDDGGGNYTEPEWTAGLPSKPITHTKGTSIKIKVKLDIFPPSLQSEAYTLKGSGSSYLTFNKTATIGGGADQEITLTATGGLPGVIDILDNETIDWEMDYYGLNFNLGQSSGHKIYLTYGTPFGSMCTEKRIEWSCNAATGQSDISSSAKKIQSKAKNDAAGFAANTALLSNPWFLMYNSGDCIAHADLMRAGVEMLGINARVEVDRNNDVWTDTIHHERYHQHGIWPFTQTYFEFEAFVEVGGPITNLEGVCYVFDLGIYFDVFTTFASGSQSALWSAGGGVVQQWLGQWVYWDNSLGTYVLCTY